MPPPPPPQVPHQTLWQKIVRRFIYEPIPEWSEPVFDWIKTLPDAATTSVSGISGAWYMHTASNPVTQKIVAAVSWALGKSKTVGPKKIVELGSGDGNLASIIEDSTQETVTRTDLLSWFSGRFTNYEVVDMRALPYASASVDAVVSSFAIEYTRVGNDRRAYQEVNRVLKMGGSAVFLVHHSRSSIAAAPIDNFIASAARYALGIKPVQWFFLQSWFDSIEMAGRLCDSKKRAAYDSQSEVRRDLEAVGLQVVSIETADGPYILEMCRNLNPDKLLDSGWLVVAEKPYLNRAERRRR